MSNIVQKSDDLILGAAPRLNGEILIGLSGIKVIVWRSSDGKYLQSLANSWDVTAPGTPLDASYDSSRLLYGVTLTSAIRGGVNVKDAYHATFYRAESDVNDFEAYDCGVIQEETVAAVESVEKSVESTEKALTAELSSQESVDNLKVLLNRILNNLRHYRDETKRGVM